MNNSSEKGGDMRGYVDEFITGNTNITGLAPLVEHFREFIAHQFQFNYFSYFLLLDHFQQVEPQSSIRYLNAPPEFIEKYVQRRYHKSDPILRKAAKPGAIVTWRDIIENPSDLSPDEHTFISFLKSQGFIDGVGISIFSPPGRLAFIGLSTKFEKFDFKPTGLRQLYIICSEFHHRYESLLEEQKHFVLTPRETEVLKWVSRGKSNSSIGGILGISTHTVDTLVRRCLRKMGAHNRLELTLRAVSHGLV